MLENIVGLQLVGMDMFDWMLGEFVGFREADAWVAAWMGRGVVAWLVIGWINHSHEDSHQDSKGGFKMLCGMVLCFGLQAGLRHYGHFSQALFVACVLYFLAFIDNLKGFKMFINNCQKAISNYQVTYAL
jgi:hypothetical protein